MEGTPESSLPGKVDNRLRQVRRRSLLVRLQTGLLRSLAVALVIVFVAMTIDRIDPIFNAGVRWLLSLCSLAVSLALLAWWSLPALLARRSAASVARQVDDQVPELEERWSTVTELAASKDAPELRGSEEMIKQVAVEANELEDKVEPKQVVSTLGRKRMAVFAGAAFAVFAIQFVFDGARSTALLMRFLFPGAGHSHTQIAAVPGDVVIGRDEPLKLAAKTEGGQPEEAKLMLRNAAGEETEIALQRDEDTDDPFMHRFEKVSQSFEYRFRADDGQTEWRQVTVAERPRLAAVKTTIKPPAYTKLPAEEKDELPTRMRLVEGTELEVAFQADQPLSEMALKMAQDRQAPLTKGDDGWWRFRTTVTSNMSFSVNMRNEQGLEAKHKLSTRVAMQKDRAPTVKLLERKNNQAARPGDSLDVNFEAQDDFGVEKAELVVTTRKPGEAPQTRTLPIDLGKNQGQTSFRQKAKLNLAALDLETGDEVSYAIQVTDNRSLSTTSKDDQKAKEQSKLAQNQPNDGKQANSKSGSQGQQSQSKQSQVAKSGKQSGEKKPGAESQPNENQNSQNQQLASAQDSQKQSAAKDPSDPSNKPPNPMSKRMLPGQCTACKPMKLKIDEWAGEYQGDRREKQQLAIESILRELEALLASADEQNTQLSFLAREKDGLVKSAMPRLKNERETLERTSKQISELKRKTSGTPYALIGLQIHDVHEVDIAPARRQLASVVVNQPTKFTNNLTALEKTGFHIAAAQRKLADLSRVYEQQKRDENIAAAMQKLEKMHRIFLENTQAMLGSAKARINSYDRKIAEVEEEFVREFEKLLNEKKKILEELARLLGEDPRLLRRYLAATKLHADTLRDQLTLLHRRQAGVNEFTRDALNVAEGETEAFISLVNMMQARTQNEISRDATKLFENLTTWVPLDLDPNHPLLQTSRDQSKTVIDKSDLAMKHMVDGHTSESATASEVSLHSIHALKGALPRLDTMATNHARLIRFTQNRLHEAGDLVTAQSGVLAKFDAVKEGAHHIPAQIDQHDVASDTAKLFAKLVPIAVSMGGMSAEIDRLADALVKTVNDEVIEAQNQALDALAVNDREPSLNAQTNALAGFVKAEAQIDELFRAVIAKLDEAPPPEEMNAKNRTLDEWMELLQEELKACEKLGIPCRPINIKREMDWTKQGGSSGGSGGSSSAASALAQAQAQALAQAQAEALREAMERELRAAAADAEEARNRLAAMRAKQGDVNERELTNFQFPGAPTDAWNKLASKLGDELRQSRDNNPPERYRKAIEQYFRQLAEDLPQRN